MRLVNTMIDPIRLLTSLSEEARQGWILLLSILPYCVEKPSEAAAIFRERIVPFRNEHPAWTNPLFMAKDNPRILVRMLQLGMWSVSKRFVAGNDIDQILATIYRLSNKGLYSNIDILGEEVRTKKEEEYYAAAYYDLVERLGRTLPYGMVSVSFKPSSFCSQISLSAPERAADRIVGRIVPIMDLLLHYGGHGYIDAETGDLNYIHRLVSKKLYEHSGSAARTVLQAFLKNSRETLDEFSGWSDPRNPLWIRLVRGAYWPLECFLAELREWNTPRVFTKKNETDAQYDDLLIRGLNCGLAMVEGSHNVDSIYFGTKVSLAIGKPIREIQVLYGVGEVIAEELVKKGWPVRVYVPAGCPRGSAVEQLAYDIRRLDESKVSMIMQASGAQLEFLRARLQDVSEFPPKLQEKRMS